MGELMSYNSPRDEMPLIRPDVKGEGSGLYLTHDLHAYAEPATTGLVVFIYSAV